MKNNIDIFEKLYKHSSFSFNNNKIIFEEKTNLQHLIIFENDFFGKIVMLDNIIQLTYKDEFIYHEMMTHVPIFTHINPENILIIGGGDGGIAREVLKHENIKKCTQVEIDKSVIDLSLKYLPEISNGAYDDGRFRLIIEDGSKFVQNTKESFDIIIVDSTDPEGPAGVLFTKEFYKNCNRCLNENGILVTQNGVPFFQANELKQSINFFRDIFRVGSCYIASIPTYLGGHMTVGFATNNKEYLNFNLQEIIKKFENTNLNTKYYNPNVHVASFALPNFINSIIN